MIVVLVGAGFAASAASATIEVRPSVRVTDTSPFTVRGSHFRPLERVKMTVHAKREASRTVRATGRGAFVARFESVGVGACPSYSVSAIGARGSRATDKLAGSDCPPPGSP